MANVAKYLTRWRADEDRSLQAFKETYLGRDEATRDRIRNCAKSLHAAECELAAIFGAVGSGHMYVSLLCSEDPDYPECQGKSIYPALLSHAIDAWDRGEEFCHDGFVS